MKILIASPNLDVTCGFGNITFELLSSLRDKGHDVTLLLPVNRSREESNFLTGVTVEYVLPPVRSTYRSKMSLKYFLWKYSSDHKFDLVHSLFGFPYAPIMCREAKRMNVPFVMGVQGTYGVMPLSRFPDRWAMKYAYSNAAAIQMPSVYTREAVYKESGQRYNVTIIHNGVNFERFHSHGKASVSVSEKYKGKKVLLTVGQVKNRKGQDLVIKALPDIMKKHPEVVYVMVGNPTWQKYLYALSKELGVQDNIEFAGVKSGSDLLDYFYVSDVYVHTPVIYDKYQFEGFGIVYLEAGACGKPAVGTDAGGIKDALLHNKTGLVAPDRDVEKISEYIISLLDSKELRDEYGEAGSKYAKQHTWDKITDEYIKMYKSVLK